jgi:hypothetical protein
MKYHIVYLENNKMIVESFYYGSVIRHFVNKNKLKNYVVLHGEVITFKGVEDEKKN